MQIKMNCNIENVETYTGKNGFGANITVSQLVNKKRINYRRFIYANKNEL